MELELRKHFESVQVPNFKDVAKVMKKSDDFWFYWALVVADWEEELEQALLDIVVDLYITIHSLSFTSAWIKKYKADQKKSVQKSKGLRKQLCSQ